MSPNIFINHSSSSPIAFLASAPNNAVRPFHTSLPAYQSTPLISLPTLAQELGIKYLLVKDESERFGLTAFKILGASWATYRALIVKLNLHPSSSCSSLISLNELASAAKKERITLYAATDGNHGRAVSRMAKYLGIQARIYVPKMLDKEAIDKIKGEGAEVTVWGGDYDGTVLATKIAAENHEGEMGVLISDTALDVEDQTAKWIVEGYQTMFDEIEEQVLEITGENEISHVVTPVGVGSLAQAVVTHFQRAERENKPAIVAVEPKSAACLKASLEKGEMTTVKTGYTICTGMCCGTLSAIGWEVLKNGIVAAVAVEDLDVDAAVKNLQTWGINAGPCGAASLAGLEYLLKAKELALGPEAVVVLLCTEGKRGYEIRE